MTASTGRPDRRSWTNSRIYAVMWLVIMIVAKEVGSSLNGLGGRAGVRPGSMAPRDQIAFVDLAATSKFSLFPRLRHGMHSAGICTWRDHCRILAAMGSDVAGEGGKSSNATSLLAPPRRPGFPAPVSKNTAMAEAAEVQKDPPKTLTLAQSKGNTPAGNGPSDSRKDEGGGPSGKVGQAKVGKSGAEVGDSLPNNLMKYTASRKLMNALEPYAARFQSPPGNQDIVLLRAVGAVAGLNHLKRCERDLKANALERERFDSIMRVFANTAREGMAGLNAKHLSLLINAVAGRNGFSSLLTAATERVLSLCASSIDEGLDATLDGRAAAMILNSLSKARSSDARVFASISQVILALGDGHVSLGGQNVGLILNAFSKAGKTDAGLFAFLSRQAQALPTADVDAQALSNILNAFANANIKDEALLKHMAGVACAIPLASYSSQAISNIVNAYARAGVKDDYLLSYLSSAAQSIPSGQFSSQAIATCVNGWSKLGVCDGPLFRYLSAGALRLPPATFNSQSISVILNGFARCKVKDERLVTALDKAVIGMRSLDVKSISAIAGAFSRSGAGSEALYQHLLGQFLATFPPARGKERPNGDGGVSFWADVGTILSSFEKRPTIDMGPIISHAWRLLQHISPDDLKAGEIASMLHIVSRMDRSAPSPGLSTPLDSIAGLLLASIRRGITAVSKNEREGAAKDNRSSTDLKFTAQWLSMSVAACARLGSEFSEALNSFTAAAVTLPPDEYDLVGIVSLLAASTRISGNDSRIRLSAGGQVGKETDGVSSGTSASLGFQGERALMDIARERVLSASESEMSPSLTVAILGALGNAGLLPSDAELLAFMEGYVRKLLMDHNPKIQPANRREWPSLLSQLAGSMANAGVQDEDLWCMVTSAVALIGRGAWDADSLPTILNAYARAGRGDAPVFNRLGQVVLIEIVGEGEPAASVKGGDYELWGLSPSAIGGVLNSYTKVEAFNEEIFRRLSALALLHFPALYDAVSISNIVNAYARSGFRDARLFSHMADAVESLHRPDAQTLSIIANAFARASERDAKVETGVFDHIARHTACVPEGSWTPQAAANLLNAFSRVERRNEDAIRHVCKALRDIPPDKLDPQSIASTFHSVAVLHVVDVKLLRHISNALEWMPAASCGSQVAANVAWSAAVMRPFFFLVGNSPSDNTSDRRLLSWVWEAVTSHFDVMDRNCKSQVHQLIVSHKMEKAEIPASISQAMQDSCRASFKENSNIVTFTSTLQADVARSLKSLGYQFEEEAVEEITGYSLDILVRDKNIVIEVDGPTHFCNGSRQPLGSTVLKHRQLRGIGYTLVTVPYWDWKVADDSGPGGAGVDSGEESKKEYLAKQIQIALECRGGTPGEFDLADLWDDNFQWKTDIKKMS